MSVEAVKKAIQENPDAKAVFVNNPTYYGICSDLRAIVELAHANHMLCLVDEAHGTHFYFSDKLPLSAMDAGADMAAVSMHKSGGSLTQSSLHDLAGTKIAGSAVALRVAPDIAQYRTVPVFCGLVKLGISRDQVGHGIQNRGFSASVDSCKKRGAFQFHGNVLKLGSLHQKKSGG